MTVNSKIKRYFMKCKNANNTVYKSSNTQTKDLSKVSNAFKLTEMIYNPDTYELLKSKTVFSEKYVFLHYTS